jgi:hypothetical protein
LLTHQPPSWFAERAKQDLYGEIARPGRFAVHLFGHNHEPATRSYSQGGAEHRNEWLGCSLFGLEEWGEGTKKKRLHGYAAGRIELAGDNGFLRQWPRQAVPHQAGHLHMVPDPHSTLQEDEGTRPEIIRLHLWFAS